MSKKQKFMLIICAISMAFVIAEAVLRISSERRIDPLDCKTRDLTLDHSLVPNSHCRFKTKEWDVDFKVNSQGLRDFEYTLEKPQDTYRILILGDSFIEGFGVELEETFGKILEKDLNEISDPKVEIINAGVNGWSPVSEYLFLSQYGIKYSPDLVILNFNSTDFFDDYDYHRRLTPTAKRLLEEQPDKLSNKAIANILAKGSESQLYAPPELSQVFIPSPIYTESVNDPKTIPLLPVEVKFFLNQNVYTYRTLTHAIKVLIGRATKVEISPPQDRGKPDLDLFAITRSDDMQPFTQLINLVQTDILKMKDIANTNDSEFFLLITPHGHMVNGKEWKQGRKIWGFETGKTYSDESLQQMARWATNNNMANYNLTLNLRKAAKNRLLYFTYDGHWNKNGHEVVAQALLSAMYEKVNNL